MSDLKSVEPKHKNKLLMLDVETNTTCIVTIEQLLGLQQEALAKPCKHCGNIGSYDSRGNCGCCGAPKG
jgi:hypothetical protein